MHTGYTIVVNNQDTLSSICGSNDTNLQIIEDYLGVPVYSIGNELTVASSDNEVCRKFQDLVDKLLLVEPSAISAKDFVSAFLTHLHTNDDSFFKNFGLTIPHGTKRVFPKTLKQAEFIKALQQKALVFGIGPAGTGKTYLAIAHALSLVLSKKVQKIILTRPVVEAGESLGFLPGDLEQKISPYLRPLYDAIENLVPVDIIRKMEESRMIEIAPLAYMRGRSLNDAIIILDEAQNTSIEQMKMFLTRMGENSKIIVTGDPSQIDRYYREPSGLVDAIQKLSSIDEIGVVEFHNQDVVRNSLVKKIVQAYEKKD